MSIGWFGGNPLDTTYSYDVFLDTDNPPVTKIGNAIKPQTYLLDIAPLAANTCYYYKVVAKNKITVDIRDLNNNIQATLSDILGNKLHIQTVRNGNNTINVNQLANGMYLLYIETEKEIMSKIL